MNEITTKDIQKKIYRLPNRPPFMLGIDLAGLYETHPRQVAQAVRRNPARFPDDFAFKLTWPEIKTMRLQNEVSLKANRHNSVLAFTRMGANQLSAVLKSDKAAERSVMIMRAFSAIEERLLRTPDHGSLKVGPVQSIHSAEDIFGYFDPNYRQASKPPLAAVAPAALPTKTITLEEFSALQEERAELYRFKCSVLEAKAEPKPRRAHRAISESERQEIVRLKRLGVSNYEIAHRVGRPRSTVRTLLRSNGFAPYSGGRP